MRTIRPVITALGLIAVMFSVPGCGKSASSLGSKHTKVFAASDPATKTAWDTALAAMSTNGYVAASQAFKQILAGNPTPEQIQAVTATATALSDQMYEAANKGDASATAAIKELGKTRGR